MAFSALLCPFVPSLLVRTPDTGVRTQPNQYDLILNVFQMGFIDVFGLKKGVHNSKISEELWSPKQVVLGGERAPLGGLTWV